MAPIFVIIDRAKTYFLKNIIRHIWNIAEKVAIFAKNKNDMNTLSMNNLWSYLQGLSLSDSNKRWLGQRLIDSANIHQKSEKEKMLESLSGVWGSEDGEKIQQAIMGARIPNITIQNWKEDWAK